MTGGPRALGNRVSLAIALGLATTSLAILVHGYRMTAVDAAWGWRLVSWAGVAFVMFSVMAILPAGLRLNLSISVAAIVVGAFLFNVFLAYTPSPAIAKGERIAEAQRATPGFDHRTVLEVVRDLHESGVDAVPAMFGVTALEDEQRPKSLLPLIGVSSSTTVLCNELGRYAIYVSDEHGFNNPPSVDEEVEVLLVGDSFMHGQCVQPGQDIAGLLRAAGYRAYSIGSSGNGPLLNLAGLVEYGLRKKPKIVIWGYAGNDPTDLRAEMFNPTLRRYLDEPDFAQSLVDRQDEIDRYWRDLLKRNDYLTPKPDTTTPAWKAKPTLRQLATLYSLRRLLGLRRQAKGEWRDTFRAVLRSARTRVAASGGKLYFLAFPYFELVEASPSEPREIFEIVRPTGVESLDVDRHFFEAPDPAGLFPLRMPGHFSEAGYALVAERIIETILEPAGIEKRAHPR